MTTPSDAGRRSLTQRFEALIEPHYETLYRTAYRLTRSVHDAEDMAQEVCIRALPRVAELEGLDYPRGWLLKVLYNLYIDSARRYERLHVVSSETVDLGARGTDEPGPPELAERSIEQQRLDRAWQFLDREQRTLLALHDVEGYTLHELMGLMGLKEGTLKSKLHRARVRLGKLLQREPSTAAPPRAVGAQR
jgi:RNA polymerase sigma-70 factor (ECF subfamily)